MPGDQPTRIGDRAAEFVRRHFLWLLVACYILAIAWPAPGIALRGWEWRSPAFAKVSLASLLLLAVMLFIAALFTELNQLRIVSRHPFVLISALVAVWLGPALLVFAADWIMPSTVGGRSTAGLIVGFALVASMPVANSSIGWTQSAGGNLGLGLALVVVSIVLCPWITPNLLTFFGSSLAESAQDCEALVNQFSGVFFIVWVILPTAAGLALPLFCSRRATRSGTAVAHAHERRRAARLELHQLGAGAAQGVPLAAVLLLATAFLAVAPRRHGNRAGSC